ncbi:MAG: TerD family protein [Alphaproteobacteria bacterium]|nr:TerD family protein [Alphaproteobacteria bacterium]
MPSLKKGKHTRLNVMQTSGHRIYVGLGWDPNAHINFMQKSLAFLGIKKTNHNLDLSCQIYDSDKNLIDAVTVNKGEGKDKTGFIYHSGDNKTGFDYGDDEEISAELLRLPDYIQHLVFIAFISSGHSFCEVAKAEIHIADGYSNHDFLRASFARDVAKDSSFYLFAHIYRKNNGWMLHNIDEFFDAKIAHKNENLIKEYLITK